MSNLWAVAPLCLMVKDVESLSFGGRANASKFDPSSISVWCLVATKRAVRPVKTLGSACLPFMVLVNPPWTFCAVVTGAQCVCTMLGRLSHGLTELRLSRIGMTSIGINRIAETLMSNANILATLKHLDLSHNALRGEDMMVSFKFLVIFTTVCQKCLFQCLFI